jgi:hypothetical protein
MNKGDFHGAYFHCKFQKDRLDLLTQVRRVSAKHPNNNHSPSEADGISSLTKLLNSAERELDNSDDDVLDDELEKALLASPIQSYDPSATAKRTKLNSGEGVPGNNGTAATSSQPSSNQSDTSAPGTSAAPNAAQGGGALSVNTNGHNHNGHNNSNGHSTNGYSNNSDGTPLKPGTQTIRSAQNHGHKGVVIPGNAGVPLPPHPFLLMPGAKKVMVRPRIPNNLPGILPDEAVNGPSGAAGAGDSRGSNGGVSGAVPGMPTIAIPALHRGISQNTEAELQLMLAAGMGSGSTGKPSLSRASSDMWAQIDIEHANPVDSMIDELEFGEEGRGASSCASYAGQAAKGSPSIVPFSGCGANGAAISPLTLPPKVQRDHSNLHLLSTVAFHRSSSQESEGGDSRLPVIEVKTLLSAEDEENQP